MSATAVAEVTGPATLDAVFARAVTFGCEGLVCTSARPDSADERVELFTRRLEEISGQFPDVAGRSDPWRDRNTSPSGPR